MKFNFSKKKEVRKKIRSVIHPTDYHNNFARKADTTFDLNLKQNRTSINLHPASVLVPLQFENSTWQVILTRRSMNMKKHSGHSLYSVKKNTAEFYMNIIQIKVSGKVWALFLKEEIMHPSLKMFMVASLTLS